MTPWRIKYFISLLVLIFFAACEREVGLVYLPDFKQMLAITAFISPLDSTSYFFVTSNKKLYGELNTEKPLGNLTGFISDGSNEVALDTIPTGFNISREKMTIKNGETYKLKVKSENGLSAEATCTVPEKRSFSLKADTFFVLKPFSFGDPNYRFLKIKLTFSDFPGEENYYRILGKITVYDTNHNSGSTYENSIKAGFEKEFFTDKGMDGKDIIQITTGNISNYFNNSHDSVFLKIYLFNTEKSYYLYHKSMKDYKDGSDPFSEATPVYSNISGGLGVFTSYTVDSLIVRLK
jgi:hypothetical protein